MTRTKTPTWYGYRVKNSFGHLVAQGWLRSHVEAGSDPTDPLPWVSLPRGCKVIVEAMSQKQAMKEVQDLSPVSREQARKLVLRHSHLTIDPQAELRPPNPPNPSMLPEMTLQPVESAQE